METTFTLTAQDVAALVGFVFVFIGIYMNRREAHAATVTIGTATTAAPAAHGTDYMVIPLGLIILGTVLATLYGPGLFDSVKKVAGGSVNAPPVASQANVPDPDGYTFDATTGELKGPIPVLGGYVLVVKYESASRPLKGDQEKLGADKGTGQKWVLPKDALNIEVMHWDKKANATTNWVPVP